MELFDSHAHYNDEKFNEDKEQILENVYNQGITKIICAGYSKTSSEQAVKIAKNYSYIYATVGISPNDIPQNKTLNIEQFKKEFENEQQQIQILAQNEKVVAIGEIGLDYYWNKENKEEQQWSFIKQIELANKMNLPIVIHTREAVCDTINILKNEIAVNKKGVFHCCPLNIELIKEALKLGFYISFAGPITFKNSKNAIQVINNVPLEKMLVETDSPYLAPEPKRGTRNNSSNVKYIAQKIASVKNMPVEEIAKITYENTQKLFNIK